MTENDTGPDTTELTEPTELDRPSTDDMRSQALRRLHLISAAVIVVVAALLPAISEQYRSQLAPLYAVGAGLALFTLAWYRFARGAVPATPALLAGELVQIGGVSGIAALTNGSESPLVFLYYPPLLLAGLTIGVRAAVVASALVTCGFFIAGLTDGSGGLPLVSAAWWANVVSIWVVGATAAILGQEITRSQRNMADAKDRAERFSSVDWLTGLYNRRHLDTLVPQEIARARRHDRPVSLMIADADHLKDVNDTLGHLLGDQLLIHIAEVLLEQVRLVDTVVRYGGDEFIVIMPDTDPEGALIPAERIRAAMDGYEVTANGVTVRTSISAGLAAFPTDAEDAVGLLARADAALYMSKRSGRNRVTIYRPDLPTDRTPLARELEVVE